MIEYEWDEAKRLYNLSRRGLDFSDAWRVYEAEDKITLKSPYPHEERRMDMAAVDSRVLVLVYTMRGEVVRCISFRYAKRGKEGDCIMGKIVRHTSDELKRRESQSDWDRAARMTDEEIEAADRDDPDMDGIDDDWMDKAIVERPHKKAIYAKFDADVIEYYQSLGRGYQARMNAVLRAYMEAHPLNNP